MPNKTIQEINLEILRDARDILMSEFYQKDSSARSLFEYFVSKGDLTSANAVEFPKPPSFGKIQTLAAKMRAFILSEEGN